jgi:hypothetical protein
MPLIKGLWAPANAEAFFESIAQNVRFFIYVFGCLFGGDETSSTPKGR